MKRFLSMLLIVVLVFGMLPTAVFADQTVPVTNVEDQAIIDNENLTVTGSNHLGNMLSKDIQREQADNVEALQTGYDVVSLTVENNVATVEFYAKGAASIVVAIYSEDRTQLLTSATVDITEDETVVSLRFPDALPEYFHASTYMVSKKDQKPLCTALHTSMYTKEIQDLLASDIYDYNPELVVNLDERTDTNFAVYNEDTVVVQEQTGINTIVSVDDENLTYVIDNPSQEIKSLMYGDVLSLPYGEDILFVKVDRVTVSGTRATITGLPIEMQDIFSHVKIDGEAGAANAEVDTTTADEGVTFEGISQDRPTRFEGESSASHTLTYKFYKELETGKEGQYGQVGCKVNGSLSLKFSIGVKYYITWTKQEFKFSIEAVGTFKLGVEGTAKLNIPLGQIAIPVFAGIQVGLDPSVVYEVNGKAELTVSVTSKFGFAFNTADGIKDISEPIKGDASVEAEITIFVGLDLAPQVSVISPSVAKVTASAPFGVELTAKMTGFGFEGPDALLKNNHTCNACVDIDLYSKFGLTIKMTLLNKKWLTWSFKVLEIKDRILGAYYSIDHKEFDWGECPYKAYPLTVTVLDSNEKAVEGVTVQCTPENLTMTTDSKGKATAFLPKGEYTLTAAKGDYTGDCKVTVDGAAAATIDIILTGKVTETVKWKLSEIGTLTIFGNGAIPGYSGTSGLPWASYVDRVKSVIISGDITGIGANVFQNHTNLQSVYIGSSVSSMDLSAFSGLDLQIFSVSSANNYYIMDSKGVLYSKDKTVLCKAFFSLVGNYDVPNTVTRVASKAFAGQKQISLIHFMGNAPSIESDAFSGITSEVLYCIRTDGWTQDKLQNYGGTVTWNSYDSFLGSGICGENITWVLYDDGVLRLTGSGAMYDYASSSDSPWYALRSQIKEVVFTKGITNIASYAFYGCVNLTDVTLPDTITSIDAVAFFACTSLTEISLPSRLTTIGNWAFDGCSKLTHITVPETVTSIGGRAFAECYELKTVHLPESLTQLDDYVFFECVSLETMVLPQSIKTIGERCFYNCTNLKKITFPKSLESIGIFAFENCKSLTQISLPGSLMKIGTGAFSYCSGLVAVKIGASQSAVSIESGAFAYCAALRDLRSEKDISQIGDRAFRDCKSLLSVPFNGTCTIGETAFENCIALTSISIPNTVTLIGSGAFKNCSGLSEVTFCGDAPYIAFGAFVQSKYYTYITAYYPAGNATWTEAVRQDYGGNITWVAYTPTKGISPSAVIVPEEELAVTEPEAEWDVTEPEETVATETVAEPTEETVTEETVTEPITEEAPETQAQSIAIMPQVANLGMMTGGSQSDYRINSLGAMTESLVAATKKPVAVRSGNQKAKARTVTFEGLDAGAEYIFLSLINDSEENLLIPENLLYIDQLVADSNGTITVTYIPRISSETVYEMVAGGAGWNIADATVTWPALETSGELKYFSPAVTYKGTILKEGRDYILDGDVTFNVGGSYTCYIVGIGNYTGSYTCDYTVETVIRYSEGLAYTLSSDGTYYSVSGIGTCTDTRVFIPPTYNDLPVKTIGYFAFFINSSMQSITIPSSVTSILDTFSGCSNLASIWVDKDNANYSSDASGVLFNKDQTQIIRAPQRLCGSYILPDSVTSIRASAFSYCSSLTNITIPKNVTSIGNSAFSGCSGLTSITIPKNVTSIGSYAFSGCSGLTSITIPNNVTSIYESTFAGCSSLVAVRIPYGVSSIDYSAFKDCTSLESVFIPDSVTSIGAYAFSGCSQLTSVNIPKDITIIENYTFSDCSSLTDITIPNNVTSIGNYAFSNCSSLTTLIVPNSVTSIGNYAFSNCSSLTRVTLSEGVTSIGDCMFYNCVCLASVTIPSSVTSIGHDAFNNCVSLVGITIPNSVTSIGFQAFCGCDSLTSIVIPNSITEISSFTFSGCINLTSVTIPNSVTSIGGSAFWGCSGLITIIIPESVTSVENYAFYNCSSLTAIRFKGNAPTFEYHAFLNASAIVYYPAGNSTWTPDVMRNYGGTIGWIAAEPCTHGDCTILPAVDPTCTGSGWTEGKQCKRCGEVLRPRNEIPAYGHSMVTMPAVSPTCTGSGWTEGKQCERCGEVLQPRNEIPAYGHTMVAMWAVSPTCTTSGKTKGSYCSVCGDILVAQQIIPALGHAYESVITAPTPFDRGYTTHTCTKCGDIYVDSYTVYEVEGYLNLSEDQTINLSLTEDLYVNLNGYTLSGTIDTNGFKVYGVDVTTNNYTCEKMGYFNCVDENGKPIAPESLCTMADGKRYMTIGTDDGYTFHRFYLGITNVSLAPSVTGFGYKAEFYGDEMVQSQIASIGYSLWLTEDIVLSRTAAFQNQLTLRLKNYNVNSYGETPVNAKVYMTLKDGTKLESAVHSYSMRTILETINAEYAGYSAQQLAAIQAMVEKYAVIKDWDTANLFA